MHTAHGCREETGPMFGGGQLPVRIAELGLLKKVTCSGKR
jgi:hypothetical protein